MRRNPDTHHADHMFMMPDYPIASIVECANFYAYICTKHNVYQRLMWEE